jgi:hypothetical protein
VTGTERLPKLARSWPKELEMRGGKARSFKCLLGSHSEVHVVQNDLKGCLILLVAARHGNGHHRIVLMEK